MGERTVWVDFACNDPNTGLFDGRVEAIQVHTGPRNETIELERWGAPMRLTDSGGDKIRFARRLWPTLSIRPGVGNWCWDGYAMWAETAAEFLITLRRWNWNCECAETSFFDWWKDDGPANTEWLARYLGGSTTALHFIPEECLTADKGGE